MTNWSAMVRYLGRANHWPLNRTIRRADVETADSHSSFSTALAGFSGTQFVIEPRVEQSYLSTQLELDAISLKVVIRIDVPRGRLVVETEPVSG